MTNWLIIPTVRKDASWDRDDSMAHFCPEGSELPACGRIQIPNSEIRLALSGTVRCRKCHDYASGEAPKLKRSDARKGSAVSWDDAEGPVEAVGSNPKRPKLPWSFKGLSFLEKRSDAFWKGKKGFAGKTMRAYERIHGEPWFDPAKPQGFRDASHHPEVETSTS